MGAYRLQSSLAFQWMSLEFLLRDWLRPPAMILMEAGLGAGMNVLDFGCGPGGFSLAAARIVGDNGLVYAMDIHPLAIKSVRLAAERQGIGNIRAISEKELKDLPDHCMDFAILYDVLHDIESPGTVMTDMSRVLRSNGALSVSDHHLTETSLLSTATGGHFFRFAGKGRWTYQFEKTKEAAGTP